MVIVNDRKLKRLSRLLADRANFSRRLRDAVSSGDEYYVGVWTRNLNSVNSDLYQMPAGRRWLSQ